MSRRRYIRSDLLRDLAISLVSGVILAVGGNALAMLAGTCSGVSIPAWLFIVVALVSMLVAFFLTRYLTRATPQAFILISAFTRTLWLASLLDNVVRALDRHGVDLVVKFPPYDFSGQSQLLQMNSIRAKRSSYVGGLVVCSQPERMQSELVEFCRSIRLPIVFVDVRPFPSVQDYPAGAVFIGCDPDEIGEQAARWMGRELLEAGKERPSIFIVAGDGHVGRHSRFIAKIRDIVSPSRIKVNREAYAKALKNVSPMMD